MSDEVAVNTEVEDRAAQEAKDKADKAAWFADLKVRFGPGAPDEAIVEAWKKSSGRVRVAAFTIDEIYFYRPLRSTEYKGLIAQVMNIKGQVEQNELLKEKMVAAAVLWPRLDASEMGALFAGTKDSLHLMIMQASNFVTQEEAELMVREL